jgi:hypothetical protein
MQQVKGRHPWLVEDFFTDPFISTLCHTLVKI